MEHRARLLAAARGAVTAAPGRPPHERSTRRLTSIAAALLIAVPTVAAAHGSPVDGSPVDGPPIDSEAAAQFAREYRVTPAEAERRLRGQLAFVDLITTVVDRYGEEALDHWIADDGVTFHIRTDHRAVRDQVRLASGRLPVVVHRDPPQAPRTLARVERPDVRQVLQGSHVHGVSVDSESGDLLVETGRPDLLGGLPGLLDDLDIAVKIEHSDGPAEPAATFRGGAAMSGCTAGFTAKFAGQRGVVSAAHCGPSTRLYTGVVAKGTYATVTRRTARWNANADIGFYSIPKGHSVRAAFFAHSTIKTTPTAKPATVTKNAWVCKRGKVSGYTCGRILSTATRPGKAVCNGGCNPVFYRAMMPGAKGDSGGPWFVNGNRPIGITAATSSSGLIASKITQLPKGVSILR